MENQVLEESLFSRWIRGGRRRPALLKDLLPMPIHRAIWQSAPSPLAGPCKLVSKRQPKEMIAREPR